MAFMLPEILRVDRLEDAVVVEESKGTVLLILACCVDPGPRPRGNWFISSFAKSQGVQQCVSAAAFTKIRKSDGPSQCLGRQTWLEKFGLCPVASLHFLTGVGNRGRA